jgi:hypothetical protein
MVSNTFMDRCLPEGRMAVPERVIRVHELWVGVENDSIGTPWLEVWCDWSQDEE